MYLRLFKELEATMFDVCHASLGKHAGEDFYCVALFTSGEYRFLADAIATTQGLELVAKKYLVKKHYREEWGTTEVAMRELKWNPCDSPYHCEFDQKFGRVGEILKVIWAAVDDNSHDKYLHTCQQIHETCIDVLSRIRTSGIFDNDRVIFSLLMGDQSNESQLLNAEELNSKGVLDRLRRELVIDEHRLQDLRRNRWHWRR